MSNSPALRRLIRQTSVSLATLAFVRFGGTGCYQGNPAPTFDDDSKSGNEAAAAEESDEEGGSPQETGPKDFPTEADSASRDDLDSSPQPDSDSDGQDTPTDSTGSDSDPSPDDMETGSNPDSGNSEPDSEDTATTQDSGSAPDSMDSDSESASGDSDGMDTMPDEMEEMPECLDASLDCPAPSTLCQEAYCDENSECAERNLNNGTIIEDWGDWTSCVYTDECVERGTRVRGRTVCDNGNTKVETEDDSSACSRNTDGDVVETGTWDICKAELVSGNCKEQRRRTDQICENGFVEPVEKIDDTCSASGDNRCGVCGNGIVEAGEVCEPTEDYCGGECNQVVFVDIDKGGSGKSWSDAFNDLQEGLDKAGELPGDVEVWVADGTYRREVETRDGFIVHSGLAMYGGFSGVESKRAERNSDPSDNDTIISGEANDTSTVSDNSLHVVRLDDEGTTPSVLDGFTIEKGRATGNENIQDQDGGGLFISHPSSSSSSVQLKNLIITRNRSNDDGGGAYIGSAKVLMENVVFTDNYAADSGGGFSVYGGSIEFRGELAFTQNGTEEDENGYGAGFSCSNSDVTAFSPSNITVEDNRSDDAGGIGIGVECTFTIAGSNARVLVKNNFAEDDAGGIDIFNGVLDVTNGAELELISNAAADSGGGFFCNRDCVVRESGNPQGEITGHSNTARSGGGAAYYNHRGTVIGTNGLTGEKIDVN